ncbi:MAG TPA: SIMPL domain-containing protein [Candidatus Baltobacteraceae bacterium]|nr:SIMPL domain-containing protein [Candidatus Baltobacteraceae bacterium]
MNVLALAAALVAVVSSSLSAAAQTAASAPVGISVSAVASVTPSAFVEQIGFERKATSGSADGESAVAQFRRAVSQAGLPASAVVAATPFVVSAPTSLIPLPASTGETTIAVATLRIQPDKIASIVKALTAVHWSPAASGAHMVPVDEEALHEQALAKATELARRRAEAIARAEGRHVGRLLNVTPEAFDFLDSFVEDLSRLSPMFNASGVPEVKAGGVFTFELLP